MEYPNPFDGADVISTYTDGQAVEDGILVAIGHKDRVSRALWEYLVEHAPLDSRPPNRWPVDMLGWFQAGKMGKDEARNKLVADRKALALSKGLISTHASQAKRVYEENIGGGIYKLFSLESLDGKRIAGLLAEAPQEEYKYSVLWLIPNENGGTTAMFPEDY